eukprot:scaffold61871_cov65-Phaeocystis_antarctica.AAC.10
MLPLLHDCTAHQLLRLLDASHTVVLHSATRATAWQLQQQVGEAVVLVRERLQLQTEPQQVLGLVRSASEADQVRQVVVRHAQRRRTRGRRAAERVSERVLRLGRLLLLVLALQATSAVCRRLERCIEAVSQLEVGETVPWRQPQRRRRERTAATPTPRPPEQACGWRRHDERRDGGHGGSNSGRNRGPGVGQLQMEALHDASRSQHSLPKLRRGLHKHFQATARLAQRGNEG